MEINIRFTRYFDETIPLNDKQKSLSLFDLSKDFEEKLYKKLKETLNESLGKPAFITTQQVKLYKLQDDIYIGSNSQLYTIHDKQPKQYNIFSLLSFIDKHTSKNLIKYTLYPI